MIILTNHKQEFKAHSRLTTYLETKCDWKVSRSTFDIETSFLAIFQHKPELSSKVISFNAEYDALPNVGHACGHNLIATGGIAAALATAEAMKKFDIAGTIKLFGTPAEEDGGGKIEMVNAGAYDDVDVSLMHHASSESPGQAFVRTAALFDFTIEYFGKSAHAAASPWEGINALDASSIFMHASALLRQQFESTDRVHFILNDGGSAANVIPDYTKITVIVRAISRNKMAELKKKIFGCVKAGALGSGCTYKINCDEEYYDMISNVTLTDCFREFYNRFCEKDNEPKLRDSDYERSLVSSASTDQGNVSWVVPSLHSFFTIKSEMQPHTIEFSEAAGEKSSHTACLKSAKCLSLTGLRVLYDDEFYTNIKSSWKSDVERVEHKNMGVDASAIKLPILKDNIE